MNRQQRRAARKAARRPKRAPTIGLAIIARDEAGTLPTLLDSIKGAFDQVVLADTGSSDRTVEVFREWAKRTGHRYVIGSFTWRDDFAAARNYAYSLLTTDFTCWADCDDTLIGARNLRRLAAAAGPHIAGYAYDYVHDDVTFPRTRLLRRGVGQWVCRVHEQLVTTTPNVAVVEVDRDVVHWRHAPRSTAKIVAAARRNNRIVERWIEEEPDCPLLAGLLEDHPGLRDPGVIPGLTDDEALAAFTLAMDEVTGAPQESPTAMLPPWATV